MTSKKTVAKPDQLKRTRKARPYPAASFTDALELGEAIMRHAAGGKIRRLLLLEKLQRSPTSSATQGLITNSTKYGLTIGSHSSEWMELTEEGKVVCDPSQPARQRLRTRFFLSIEHVQPFKVLYEEYQSKRLPDRDVMKDFLRDAAVGVEDCQECIDFFIVNIKDLNILRTIAGNETLVPIEQAAEEFPAEASGDGVATPAVAVPEGAEDSEATAYPWETTCFYVTPIGADGSDERKHADLFLNHIVEPAMKELKFAVIRADKLSQPGLITTQVLEHIKRCRLVVADLSFLNANVFYEMALRHACKLPVVHIIRKADRIPFDVNQARCIIIDDTDKYTLIPRLQTYQAEIAAQARNALADPEHAGNPVTIFYPDFWK